MWIQWSVKAEKVLALEASVIAAPYMTWKGLVEAVMVA